MTAKKRAAKTSSKPSSKPSSKSSAKTAAKTEGLARWIEEVVALHAKAKTALRVEVVHDLRVAIRRCRSLAQGLREVDDDDGAARWKALSDAGRPLFQGLGDLRDAQVMKEHAHRLLGPTDDAKRNAPAPLAPASDGVVDGAAPVDAADAAFDAAFDAVFDVAATTPAPAVAPVDEPAPDDGGAGGGGDNPSRVDVERAIDARIAAVKEDARAAVASFDVAAWRAAADGLGARAHALLMQRPLFDHLALRRFHEAKELHQQAMRSKASTALHDLRIGVKKLRYTIENFLPDAHAKTSKTLKKMQELLGDIHDLDVLVDMLASEHVRLHSNDRSRVSSRVRRHRDELVVAYRALTLGEDGAWPKVRRALADGDAVSRAHEALMQRKARAHGVTVEKARAIERSAHVLLHAFRDEKSLRSLKDARVTSLVRWACVCGAVDEGGKASEKFVERLPIAVGFNERDRKLLSVVARGVYGRAPDDERALLVPDRDRGLAKSLGAVLHLAAALSKAAPFVVKRGRDVVVVHTASALVDARDFAERRAPLEAIVGMPLWWKAATT